MAFTPDAAYEMILRSWDAGRLAHAYLLHGDAPEDLERLAARIGCLVNGWHGVASLDEMRQKGALVIEPEGKMRRIPVDLMRGCERSLNLTSDLNYKLCVISAADRLGDQGANAFLKTLEEPPPNTLILLLTTAPEQLLETILSRCVRVPLFRQSSSGMLMNTSQRELAEVLARWFGAGPPSPTRAAVLQGEFQKLLERLRASITQENEEALDGEKATYAKATDGVWLRDRADYYDNLTEAVYHSHRQGLLGVMYTWLGEILRRLVGLPAMDLPQYEGVSARAAEHYSVADLQRRISAIDEIRGHLATTVRESLALDVCFPKAFG